ncbi:MAG TPA: amidase family protein, partial [Polyangiaceae bacterium]|nr:amidase family protein [Polyangiaceae bacterium]
MDVADSPALELAALLREREVSCEELVSMYLTRIERKNPALAAFVAVFRDEALRDAKAKDQVLARRSPSLPPFFGVPTAVKDLNLVAGQRARFGSRGARVTWSPLDDRMTSRLRASGFVFLGKLATSEYGVMPVTEPDIHPPTANPWSTAHSAGGSSGGSG